MNPTSIIGWICLSGSRSVSARLILLQLCTPPHRPLLPLSFLLSDFFCFLRHGRSNLVLRLGTHWVCCHGRWEVLRAMCFKGNLSPPRIPAFSADSTMKPLFLCLPAHMLQQSNFTLEEGKSSVATVTCCMFASTVLWSHYICVSCLYWSAATLPPPPSYFWSNNFCQDGVIHPSNTITYLFQYRIETEKILKTCLKVAFLPSSASLEVHRESFFFLFLFQGLLKRLLYIHRIYVIKDVHLSRT